MGNVRSSDTFGHRRPARKDGGAQARERCLIVKRSRLGRRNGGQRREGGRGSFVAGFGSGRIACCRIRAIATTGGIPDGRFVRALTGGEEVGVSQW